MVSKFQHSNEIQYQGLEFIVQRKVIPEIKQDVNIFGPVFVRLRKFLIGKIMQNYEKNPLRLDGANVIVQIDETKLKHNVK